MKTIRWIGVAGTCFTLGLWLGEAVEWRYIVLLFIIFVPPIFTVEVANKTEL